MVYGAKRGFEPPFGHTHRGDLGGTLRACAVLTSTPRPLFHYSVYFSRHHRLKIPTVQLQKNKIISIWDRPRVRPQRLSNDHEGVGDSGCAGVGRGRLTQGDMANADRSSRPSLPCPPGECGRPSLPGAPNLSVALRATGRFGPSSSVGGAPGLTAHIGVFGLTRSTVVRH